MVVLAYHLGLPDDLCYTCLKLNANVNFRNESVARIKVSIHLVTFKY